MGANQSAHIDESKAPFGGSDVRGPKNLTAEEVTETVFTSHETIFLAEKDAKSVSTEEDYDTDDVEEVDEEWSERLAILEDARYLKMMAEFYLHPEKPVASGLEARCYFDRASAPTEHETDERNLVLQEAGALKKLAVDYMHPERPVETTDATLFGRNYYGRASAPEQEDLEEMEERNLVLQEAGALKKLAVDYMHPELGVKTTDGSACGRNYFDRPSAHEHDRNIHTFPTHDDDEHTSHEHEHLDHFGFDEDTRHQLEDMREELHLPGAPAVIDDKDGGNLSRSPSSIMLFPGEVE